MAVADAAATTPANVPAEGRARTTQQQPAGKPTLVDSVLLPTLCAGTVGAIGGAVLAAHRVQSVPLYAVNTGLNWTIMSGSFFALRHAGLSLHTPPPGKTIPLDYKIYVSTLSGSVSGSIFNGLVRGRTGLARAAFVYGAFGATGQIGVDLLDAARRDYKDRSQSQQQEPQSKLGFWATVLKYTPLKQLSDDEFVDLLQTRISNIDVQIKLTNQEIERARAELRQHRPTPQDEGEAQASRG